ncbi:MAG: hypothetical protein R2761_28415 [Acidimicrobiales bacterium]
MSDGGPSRKLLILLGLSILLAAGYYGRALLGGGSGGEPLPDPSLDVVSYTTEPPAGTDDAVAWALPEQPRNPFQAVPLGP